MFNFQNICLQQGPVARLASFAPKWSEGANEATMPSLILSRPFFSDLVGTGSYFRDAIE